MNMVGHAVYAYQPASFLYDDSGNDPMEIHAIDIMQRRISSECREHNVM